MAHRGVKISTFLLMIAVIFILLSFPPMKDSLSKTKADTQNEFGNEKRLNDVSFVESQKENDYFSGRSKSNNWHTEMLDSMGVDLWYTSLVLDSNDHPHISYCDNTNGDLKYIFYDGNQWHNETVDWQGDQKRHTLLALDSNDFPHISYLNVSSHNGDEELKYAFYNGEQWSIETIDSQGGAKISLALDRNDHPHISYQDRTNYDLKYTYNDGVQWYYETVESQGSVGFTSSLVLDGSDNPHIAYADGSNWHLKYAYYDGIQWHYETVNLQGGEDISLVLDSNNLPHITFTLGGIGGAILKYAYNDGNQWHVDTVTGQRDGVTYISSALDGNDHLHISYCGTEDMGTDDDLEYVYYDGVWHTVTVDLQGGLCTSLALDSNDLPHISYRGGSDLKYTVMDTMYTSPRLNADNTPRSGTPGDSFQFNLSVFDNLGVDTVYINWSHGSLGSNLSLVDDGNDVWLGTTILENKTSNLTYSIYIKNNFELYYISEQKTVIISDNDAPTNITDNTEGIPTTGDMFTFKVAGEDNDALDSVYILYSFDGIKYYPPQEMTLVDGNYSIFVNILSNASTVYYSFNITNISTNWNNLINGQLPVNDNDAPKVDSGGDIVIDQNNIVTFNASGSSDNIGIAGYVWTFTYDNKETTLFEEIATFIFHIPGIYNVTLNVTDAAGNWAIDTMNIIVLDTTPPTANAGKDITINQSETIEFFFHQDSTDNVRCFNWTWTFEYNGTVQTLNHLLIMSPLPSFTFEIPGEYVVTMNVTDEAGNWATDTLNVTVLDITPPSAIAGPDITINQSETVEFFFHQDSKDNVGCWNWTWTFEYEDTGQKLYHSLEMSSLPFFTFEIPGLYVLTMNVTDEAGNWAIDTLNITVLDNEPPEAYAGNDISIVADTTYIFNGSGSWDNIGIADYTWTFEYNGKVVTLHGPNPHFIFDVPGDYNVTLRVVDSQWNVGEDTFTINVIQKEEDTPPNDDSEPQEKDNQIYLWTGVLIIASVIGIVSIIINVMKKKKEKEVEQSLEDELGRVKKSDESDSE